MTALEVTYRDKKVNVTITGTDIEIPVDIFFGKTTKIIVKEQTFEDAYAMSFVSNGDEITLPDSITITAENGNTEEYNIKVKSTKVPKVLLYGAVSSEFSSESLAILGQRFKDDIFTDTDVIISVSNIAANTPFSLCNSTGIINSDATGALTISKSNLNQPDAISGNFRNLTSKGNSKNIAEYKPLEIRT